MEAIKHTFEYYHLLPNQDIVIGFTASFVFWNILNLIVMNLNIPDKHLKREDHLDLRNRIVSCLHGIMSLVLSGYHYYFLLGECG